MNTSKLYAIQVPWPDGDWLYVIEASSDKIQTFNNKQEAENNAKIWQTYKVVEYDPQKIPM